MYIYTPFIHMKHIHPFFSHQKETLRYKYIHIYIYIYIYIPVLKNIANLRIYIKHIIITLLFSLKVFLFFMRKETVYIFHTCSQTTKFLKTGVYIFL